MDLRVERVVFETNRHWIVGDLTLPKEGYRSRLSDFLNRGDLDFIPLVNVELSSVDAQGHDPERKPFMAIARGHIQLAHPLEAGEMPPSTQDEGS
jgi:hypothetical protein